MKTTTTYSRILEKNNLSAAMLVAVTVTLLMVCVLAADRAVIASALVVLVMLAVAAYLVRKSQRHTLSCMGVKTDDEEASRSLFLKKIPDDKIGGSDTSQRVDDEDEHMDDTAIETLMSDLIDADLHPSVEGEVVVFRYQGGYFHASETNDNVIRIVFPRIYSVSVTRQDFLCRLLNRINATYAICKLVAVSSETDPLIEIHGFADLFYRGCFTDRRAMLRDVLAVFFEQQRSLAIGMAINEAEEMAEGNFPEEDCTSAYRDISLN